MRWPCRKQERQRWSPSMDNPGPLRRQLVLGCSLGCPNTVPKVLQTDQNISPAPSRSSSAQLTALELPSLQHHTQDTACAWKSPDTSVQTKCMGLCPHSSAQHNPGSTIPCQNYPQKWHFHYLWGICLFKLPLKSSSPAQKHFLLWDRVYDYH